MQGYSGHYLLLLSYAVVAAPLSLRHGWADAACSSLWAVGPRRHRTPAPPPKKIENTHLLRQVRQWQSSRAPFPSTPRDHLQRAQSPPPSFSILQLSKGVHTVH